MMTMTTLEAVHTLSPTVLVRAARLQYAVALMRGGTPRREASGMVRRKFECSASTAWRLVDMAADMVLIEVRAAVVPK